MMRLDNSLYVMGTKDAYITPLLLEIILLPNNSQLGTGSGGADDPGEEVG